MVQRRGRQQASFSSSCQPNHTIVIYVYYFFASFFTGGLAPTALIAGACRSAHIPRPSTQMLDPNNIEGSSGITITKHKAMDDIRTTRHQVACKVPTDVVFSDDDGSDNDANTIANVNGDKEAEDDLELAYASTQMMGDADREVKYTKLIFGDLS